MPHVTYELRDKIAVVTMDDGKANALGYTLMEELDAAYARAGKEAAAVVLTGRKGRFSAGFDLAEMMGGIDKVRAMVTRGAETLLGSYLLPMPLVVACSGHALAGGALLLATGDHRVVARGPFRIALNEVQLGLPMPILAMELARDRLNPAHLTACTLFAEVLDPERALPAGWVDEVCAEEALLDTAVAHARRLAALPREAYARTKIALRERTVKYIRATLAEDMARLIPPMPKG